MKTLMITAVCALIALPAGQALAAGQVGVQLPASARPTGTAMPAPRSAPAGTGAQANTGKALASLRSTIIGLTNEAVDYSTMTPDLATKIRGQTERMTPLLRQFGPLKNAQPLGVENGAEKYRVTFENQTTEWLIGFNDAGKIAVLLFRPV